MGFDVRWVLQGPAHRQSDRLPERQRGDLLDGVRHGRRPRQGAA